jgi:pimeloyl-ACP methyl ester carboxylesterase
MGGMIAQELTLRYPDAVRSLVLGCTSHSGLFGRWPDFGSMPRTFRSGRLPRERFMINLLYASTTPIERIEEDIRIRCACNWCSRGFLNQLAGILTWSSYRRLPRIRKRTLVLHGDQDRLVPPENGRAVAGRIPGARFELVKDAGHMMMTDQPEICTELTLAFLSSSS